MEEASAFGALPMEIYNKQSSMTGDDGNPLSEGNNGKEPIYSMAGILHFLQTEWTKFEMERSQWDVERAELQDESHQAPYQLEASGCIPMGRNGADIVRLANHAMSILTKSLTQSLHSN